MIIGSYNVLSVFKMVVSYSFYVLKWVFEKSMLDNIHGLMHYLDVMFGYKHHLIHICYKTYLNDKGNSELLNDIEFQKYAFKGKGREKMIAAH